MRPAAIGLAALLAFAGCGSGADTPEVSDEFCEAAREVDAEFATASLEEQIELIAAIVAEAPVEIRADADTFLDALERAEAGDESVVDDPDIKEAADNVHRVAQNACDLLGGGGSPFG